MIWQIVGYGLIALSAMVAFAELSLFHNEHGKNAIWVASDLLSGASSAPDAPDAVTKKK